MHNLANIEAALDEGRLLFFDSKGHGWVARRSSPTIPFANGHWGLRIRYRQRGIYLVNSLQPETLDRIRILEAA